MKFTQEIKDKWLTALRSGEYKQGQERLYNEATNSHCCLGVLGEIVGITKEEMNCKGIYENNPSATGGLYSEKIPTMFRHNAKGNNAEWLIAANDNGKSFTEIADYIEQNIPAETEERK